MSKRNKVGLHGFFQGVKMSAKQNLFLWGKRQKIKPDLCNECQGTFRTGNQFAKIEIATPRGKRVTLHQQVNSIPGVTPFDGRVRVFFFYFLLVFPVGQDIPDVLIYPGLQVSAFAFLPEFQMGHAGEFSF